MSGKIYIYKEGIYMDIIEQIDKNIDPRIYKIMNESYEEFVKKYGDDEYMGRQKSGYQG